MPYKIAWLTNVGTKIVSLIAVLSLAKFLSISKILEVF